MGGTHCIHLPMNKKHVVSRCQSLTLTDEGAVWRMNKHSGDVKATSSPSSVADAKVQTPAKPGDENYGPAGPVRLILP